jgi:cytoskeletal protein CcmA (bactofilin family)
MELFGKKKTDSNNDNEKEKPIFPVRSQHVMPNTDKVDTVIGPGSLIKGDIHSRGTLRIDGNVEGNVRADATVIVGEKGVVKANLTAAHIVIGGTVHGNVHGREKVEVLSTGRMYGDVTTAASKFVVAEGVIFEGRCTMNQGDGKQRLPREKQPEEKDKALTPAVKELDSAVKGEKN